MPFQKGNKLGDTVRPKGFKYKATDVHRLENVTSKLS